MRMSFYGMGKWAFSFCFLGFRRLLGQFYQLFISNRGWSPVASHWSWNFWLCNFVALSLFCCKLYNVLCDWFFVLLGALWRVVGIVRGLEKSPICNWRGGVVELTEGWKTTKIVIERQWFLFTNLYQYSTVKPTEWSNAESHTTHAVSVLFSWYLLLADQSAYSKNCLGWDPT